MLNKKITIIESCNFIDFPTGGNLIFVKLLLKIFKLDVILVGTTTNKDHKIGEWATVNIEGENYSFFPVYRANPKEKGIIPARIKIYLNLIRFRNRILTHCSDKIITGTPEAIGAFYCIKKVKIYHFFHGTGNAISVSRYPWLRPFAIFYDMWLMPKVAKAHRVLAAADKDSITDLEIRSKGLIKASEVIQFPTRVDESIFKRMDNQEQRRTLGLSRTERIIVTSGRLIKFKGWQLLVHSFSIFKEQYSDSKLYFIGDGSDHNKILAYAEKLNIIDSVVLVGRLDPLNLSRYLNAADLFVMGSIQEGWSTTLVEAVCCGVPAVITNFSSAKELVQDGINGYVVNSRNPIDFSKKMIEAIDIDTTFLPAKDTEKYGIRQMEIDILKILKEDI